jgi:hypothetical protein
MLKVVRGCAASPQDQDDLFQDVLLQIWSSIPAFRGEAKETTWIYRVAFNTALAWRRGERRRREGHERFVKFGESPQSQPSHDIWLQRNVVWWCWLPFTTALAVSFSYASLRFHTPKFLAFLVLFVIPLAWWGYRLSHFTVRKVLEPRRQELEALLTSLK